MRRIEKGSDMTSRIQTKKNKHERLIREDYNSPQRDFDNIKQTEQLNKYKRIKKAKR